MSTCHRPLALDLTVFHLDPELSAGDRKAQGEDEDGHFVSYLIEPMRGAASCRISLRADVDPDEAATILRKLAERIQQHGEQLLALGKNHLGHFDASGAPVEDRLTEDPAAEEPTTKPCNQ